MSQVAHPHGSTIDSITVCDLFLKYLKLEGVRHIFGVPGAAIMYILNALREQNDIEYVVCRQETGAGFIADGYWRVSAGLGVVMVTSGPGAVNALNGAMNADASMSQMLVITGEVSQEYFGRGWEQEGIDAALDVGALYKNAVDFSGLVTDAENFQTIITAALRWARGIPGRCSHVSVPVDVQEAKATSVVFPATPDAYRATPSANDRAATAEVLDGLLAARRPLIFLGNGTRLALRGDRLDPFRGFVERFGIPVMTTLDGKAIFPESHELSLRAYGKAGCMWPAYYLDPPPDAPGAAPYDYLLVIGSMLDEFATNLWNSKLYPNGAFVQVDARQQSIARGMPIDRGIIAEAGAFLRDLVALSHDKTPDDGAIAERKAYLAWIKTEHSAYWKPEHRDSNATPIKPERVMGLVSEMLPAGSHIFADAGNSCGWVSHYLCVDPPSQVHSALEVGTMGFAVGAVVGAKIADPQATCVAVCGDGGFMMQGAEVSTAHQYDVGAIWIVWNENDLNMVSQGMGVIFDEPKAYRDYYKIGDPDLVKVAEGFGATAYSVRTVQEFESAFIAAIAGGNQGRPQVIVVHEDPDDMPPFYADQFPWDPDA